LHAIAAGVGCTYAQLTGDMSQANYSSTRASTLDFLDLLDGDQWLIVIPVLCRPVWDRVAALAVVAGERRAGEPWQAIWTPPRRRMLDPTKEVAARRDDIRLGTIGWREAVAESGLDPDDQLDEIAATNKELDARGIVLDSDPRRVSRSGQVQFENPLAINVDDPDTSGANPNA